jgi:hypothetical protein
MCVFFRASDGKRPGDVSRNMDRIDDVTLGASASLMTDPRDSSLYLLAFPDGTSEETVIQITRDLGEMNDAADNQQLLEAWHGRVSARSLENNGFSPRPRRG